MKSMRLIVYTFCLFSLAALACNTVTGSDVITTQVSSTPDLVSTSISTQLEATSTVAPTPGEVEQATNTPESAETDGWENLVVFSNLSRNHVAEGTPIEHGSLPPAGGVHYPIWQNCGIYTEPLELGYAMHSLEHGAVWLTYRPDLPEEQVQQLQKLVRGHSHVLMSPYPDQESDVVMTAWGLQLEIPSVPDDRVSEFIQRYELGPQNPEPGAPCSQGIGVPEQ